MGTITEPETAESNGEDYKICTIHGTPRSGCAPGCLAPRVDLRDSMDPRSEPQRPGEASLELESPLSPASLAQRIGDLERKIKTLRNELYGDQEAIELHAREKKGFVTPRTPEPSPGLVAQLRSRIAGAELAVESAVRPLVTSIDELKRRQSRLDGFFAPMMDNMNPPLDGAQILTRAQLDKSLETLATALRGEFVEAKALVDQLLRAYRSLFPGPLHAIGPDMKPIDKGAQRRAHIEQIAQMFVTMWQAFEQAQREPKSIVKSIRLALANTIAPR